MTAPWLLAHDAFADKFLAVLEIRLRFRGFFRILLLNRHNFPLNGLGYRKAL
jgi:hypothetical protein